MAVSSKRRPLPAILIANDLRSGEVLFRAVGGWTPDLAAARVAADEAAADALEAEAEAATARQEVIDAYLVDVDLRHGAPTPRHFRELFKTRGPSVYPRLGKQAAFAHAIAAE